MSASWGTTNGGAAANFNHGFVIAQILLPRHTAESGGCRDGIERCSRHRKGAFTRAENAFDGIIRDAAGGTLFLDEIAEIGPELQPKLLRFLETDGVHGLGEAQPVKLDVRGHQCRRRVARGRRALREDLFYRLNVVRLRLPPLGL